MTGRFHRFESNPTLDSKSLSSTACSVPVQIMRVVYLSFDFAESSIRTASALARHADVLLMLPGREAEPYLGLLDRAVLFRPFSPARLRQPIRQMRMLAGLHREIRNYSP